MTLRYIRTMLASIGVDSRFVLDLYAFLAFAYLDPGTGSLILQALLGAIAAAAVAITTFWSKIKLVIGRFRSRGQARSTAAGGPGHGGD
jgi:hypothetical protein